MIHSARPTAQPVAITILTRKLFCFARFWKVGTDVRTTCEKIVITTGRASGLVEWNTRIGDVTESFLLNKKNLVFVFIETADSR